MNIEESSARFNFAKGFLFLFAQSKRKTTMDQITEDIMFRAAKQI